MINARVYLDQAANRSGVRVEVFNGEGYEDATNACREVVILPDRAEVQVHVFPKDEKGQRTAHLDHTRESVLTETIPVVVISGHWQSR